MSAYNKKKPSQTETQAEIETDTYQHIQSLIKTSFISIKTMHEQKKSVAGIPTGISDLDMQTGGLHSGELIIIAGRPSMGKTNLALNIARYASAELVDKIPSFIFSLKMDNELIMKRLLAGIGKTPFMNMRRGRLSDYDWPRLTRAACILHDSSIFFDDSPNNSVEKISNSLRHAKKEHDIQLGIIDSLQFLCHSDPSPDEHFLSLNNACLSLKLLARELNIPIILTSSLNSVRDKMPDKRPQLSDLTAIAGNAADVADMVLLIHRESLYCDKCLKNDDSCTLDHKKVAELIIAKQRNGACGKVGLTFFGEYMRFENP